MIHPSYASAVAADPQTFRDVKTQDGYTLRQYPNGQIKILVSPETDNAGYPVPGTRGGEHQGAVLTQTGGGYLSELWRYWTGRIGAYKGYGQAPSLFAPPPEGGYFSEFTGQDTASTRPGFAAGLTSGLQQILQGFTGQPGDTPLSQLTATGVQATPGIQSWVYQITNPANLQAMNRKLGRLKGQLRVETNPVRKEQLRQQISGLEAQIAYVESEAFRPSDGSLTAPSPVPLAVLGVGATALVLIFLASRKR